MGLLAQWLERVVGEGRLGADDDADAEDGAELGGSDAELEDDETELEEKAEADEDAELEADAEDDLGAERWHDAQTL